MTAAIPVPVALTAEAHQCEEDDLLKLAKSHVNPQA